MKKIIFALVSLTSLNLFAGTANINNWQIDPGGYSCFRVSNTSNVSADVTVTLYKENGQAYTGAIEADSIISSLNEPFTLPAQNTAYFCVSRISGVELGYGVIEGKASSPNTGQVQLLASGHYVALTSSRFSYQISINGGLPF
ncbi:hypothetical protein SG34_012930 [Thalassomonas viridans]|uniref:Uncharacterized protein n=1 Tax=Thalassomonas viridans TaxID=137584 RepID=A0AAE9Z811_9GAMM|nr:hypothetical protein [Thalassomonas viridans]WDE07714.1 hypothetical protein SG34_012930 [Thalassomonas viridans]